MKKLTLYGELGKELDEPGVYEFIVVAVGPNREVDWEGELATRIEWLEDDEG